MLNDELFPEIESGIIDLGWTKIKTVKRTEVSACITSIEVGTNCPRGGDAGHGGRTIIRLVDEGGTSMSVRIKPAYSGKLEEGREIPVDSIEIIFGGDAEAEVIAQLLKFAGETLERQLWLNELGIK